MIVYHGSHLAIPTPDLVHSRSNVDFGPGFYTTPLYEQAAQWALRYKRRGAQAVVSRYEIDEEAIQSLSVLSFSSYSEEWLDFSISCRNGADRSSYDVVKGGMANDKVFNTIELYLDELINKNEALKRLIFEKPNMQFCFRTLKSLDTLTYVGCDSL